MASTGFAGGLADGLSSAMQLGMQKRQYDSLNTYREQQNDIRQQLADAKEAGRTSAGGGSGKGGDYEGFDNSLIPIFRAGKPTAPAAAPMPLNQAGLSGTSPTTLQGDALQAGGLGASPQPMQPAAPEAPAEDISPRQQIVKDMMFGNLANEPDKLNAIAAAAHMHGLGDKITPWIEGLYKAKKTGVFDGAMSLINNNVDGAIDSLKKGGINLEDRPVKVNPDDPDDHKWKLNIAGTGERVMDVKNMIGSTMDADKFLKWQGDMQDSATKGRVADSQIEENKAGAQKNIAMAKAYGNGSLGAGRKTGSGTTAGPKVQRTVETDQGLVAIMSDGSKRIIADDDGTPLFGTSGQKVAAGLVGKTLDPFSDSSDIASRVNTMTGQLRGGKPAAPKRINDLPEGAKLVGTSKGKPVYEVNGKRFVGE